MNEIRLLTAGEIECRVGQCGKSQKGVGWCSILLYKDARCDMKVMDETFGPMGWMKSYELINSNLFCTVSVRDENGEWVSKQDVGVESNTEKEKGQASDAFKRACVNWGVGRELYTSPKIFITLNDGEMVEKNGKWTVSPKCVFTVTEIGYDNARNINVLTIVDKDGVVRFKMGQATEKPKDEPKDGEMSFGEQMDAFIKPELAQARTEEDVKKVWDGYSAYQNNPEFVSVVTNRLKEVKNAA